MNNKQWLVNFDQRLAIHDKLMEVPEQDRASWITDPKGYLFLDVDGILNPSLARLDGDWRLEQAGLFQVWISPSLNCWLQYLIDNGIQIVWATTWVEIPVDLAELAERLGLAADLPRIDKLVWQGNYECGKRAGVNTWLLQHKVNPAEVPVAWADDQLGIGDIAWANENDVHPIKVPPRLGLADLFQRERIENALGVGITVQ